MVDTGRNLTSIDQKSPSAPKPEEVNHSLGNRSSVDAAQKMVGETQGGQNKGQLASQEGKPVEIALLDPQQGRGQQRPGSRRGVNANGETAVEQRVRLEREAAQKKAAGKKAATGQPPQNNGLPQGDALIDRLMNDQVRIAEGNAAEQIQRDSKAMLLGEPIIGPRLAVVRAAFDFPYKYLPSELLPPRPVPNQCPNPQLLRDWVNWKEGDLARVGRPLSAGFELYREGNLQGAYADFESVRQGITWGWPVPNLRRLPNGSLDPNFDKTEYLSVLERKLVTLETVMCSNVGRIPGYAGTRYFRNLQGAMLADTLEAAQLGKAPETYNRNRDRYLSFMEQMVFSPIVFWDPLMEQAALLADNQQLDIMARKFNEGSDNPRQKPSNAILTARMLMAAMDALANGNQKEAKELIINSTAPAQAGTPGNPGKPAGVAAQYFPWIAGVFNNDKDSTINMDNLRSKIVTLYDIVNTGGIGQRDDLALDRYVTVNLLNSVEAQIHGGKAPLLEVAYTMGLEQHFIHGAHAIRQTMEAPKFAERKRSDQECNL